MKTKKQIAITATTFVILITTALNVMAKCYDNHKQYGPGVQDPGCGAYAQNGGTDNGCTQITVSPSYDLEYTSKTPTGLKYTGCGPGTITVTKTTVVTTCSGFFADPQFTCEAPTVSSTTSTYSVYEPTHYDGC
ncbi:MAG: hypothetical protein P4N60_06815 [Verrucomicrobiae bacterium]|nr:hypothetical protein [Verrucomicrobiae bacterium]